MAPASVSMWAASVSRASDPATMLTTTSTAMNETIRASARVSHRLSTSGLTVSFECPLWPSCLSIVDLTETVGAGGEAHRRVDGEHHAEQVAQRVAQPGVG